MIEGIYVIIMGVLTTSIMQIVIQVYDFVQETDPNSNLPPYAILRVGCLDPVHFRNIPQNSTANKNTELNLVKVRSFMC